MRPDGREIGAHIGDRLDIEAEEAPFRIQCKARMPAQVAAVDGTGELLARKAAGLDNPLLTPILIASGVLIATLVLLGCIWLARRIRIVLVTKLSHAAFFGESIPAGVNTDVAMLLVQGAQGLTRLTTAGAVLFFIYLWTVFLLNQFPATASWSEELRLFLVNLFVEFGGGALRALPGLFAVVIVILIARWSVRLVNAVFNEVESGRLNFSWVERETARTTQTLVVVAIWLFALVVAYPYIPGSGSEAFKGISIFIGVMFSLGSSSVIGNMIAGYTMTYRRVFKIGDRVRIGEYVGDVEQARILVTYLRTPKNEVVAIPNSTILNGEVVNYSTLAQKEGLILHTTVGIGYAAPWRQVEEMLLEAAARTPGLLREPPPFVRQLSLDDFCITYEINAYCADPQAMYLLYTELHRNILDLFNEYGVQIMTPAYEGDPEQPKLVPPDKWYAAPARPPASPRAE